ncbi:TolC family protein [uncultured Imperialibacter sp.]|mgnify:FL=1|uniref:TolC family protein n=1 Tax=uncultured Imperialibacter sp. TaxID=1672639 RepID=UPI0030D71049|tara:strand:- start:229 stop:1482 length:1254 start_codon:yes stop_codon:yes gene_type:complete
MRYHITGFLFLVTVFRAFGQGGYTLAEAESKFLNDNLLLLAEQYNVEAAGAWAIQAKLWDNPYFSAELNALNPQDNKVLDVGKAGQKGFAIEQLIHLGGQKKNEVNLARSNVKLAELQFNDLLRNLKYQLRFSYFSIYYDMVSVAALDNQISNVDSLLAAYEVQVNKGNIALKDMVRLRSLYLGLKNDRTMLAYDIIEQQSILRLLLDSGTDVIPNPTTAELQIYEQRPVLEVNVLAEAASANRPDFLYASQHVESNQWNVKWQKSLAIPDLTLGASYDQRGGAFQNQVNLTLGLPLPLWNRNQGHIKLAEAELAQSQKLYELQSSKLQNEIITALQKYEEASANYQYISSPNSDFNNFDRVYAGVLANFQKRNISLIEFTDFMESYQQSIIQSNNIRKDFAGACERINYTTSTPVF